MAPQSNPSVRSVSQPVASTQANAPSTTRSAIPIANLQAALIHFVDLVYCYEHRKPGVEDPDAEKLLASVTHVLMRNAQTRRTKADLSRKAQLVAVVGHLFQNFLSDSKMSVDDLEDRFREAFNTHGLELREFVFDELNLNKDYIESNRGPMNAAATAVAAVFGATTRSAFNWLYRNESPLPATAFRRRAGRTGMLRYVLQRFGWPKLAQELALSIDMMVQRLLAEHPETPPTEQGTSIDELLREQLKTEFAAWSAAEKG